MNVSIIQLSNGEGLPLPAYATAQSAGVDLMAAIVDDIVIAPGCRCIIHTGVAIAMPNGVEAQIRSRSGLAAKNGIHVLNSPGTIDSDYRGEIAVILMNSGKESFTVSRGMRIAQMVFAKYEQVNFVTVDTLDDTGRGHGRFGSTGV
jgi:dUTP pyrophosphatase